MHTGETWPLGRRPALDGLRGIAILLVLIGHGMQHYRIGSAAAVGVTLFFALSGYLITGILLDRPPLSRFYARRFTRLAPPLFAMVAVILLVGQIPWTHAIGALTWTQNYMRPPRDTSPFGVTWSLGVEEQFYLLWPLILAVIPRRHLPRVLLWLFLVLTVWRTYRAFGGAIGRSYVSLDCASTALVAGAYVKACGAKLSARWGVLATGLLVGMIAATSTAGSLWWMVLPIWAGPPCALLVASAESLSALLVRPWLVWFGVVSYSLYLWHETLPSLFDADTTPWGIAVGAVGGVVAYYVVERPVMRKRQETVTVHTPAASHVRVKVPAVVETSAPKSA